MSLIHANIPVFLFALVTSLLAWLYGGTIGSVNEKTVPWLMVFLLEGMLCFPQLRAGETSYVARERVWRSMRSDPLVWLVVAFLILLAIPFLNVALCPICDAALIGEGRDAAPLAPFLPFCVNPHHHLNVYLWFLPALTTMLAVKHALTKGGKRLFLEMIVWNGALLAVLGFVQQITNATGPLWAKLPAGETSGCFFSSFGYPNMAGDYFAVVFCLSVAVWMWRLASVRAEYDGAEEGRKPPAHKMFWMKHYPLIPAVLTFFAALNTLSRAGILLASSAAVVLFSHASVITLSRMKKAARVRAGAFCALSLVLIAVAASIFLPEDIRREVDTLDSKEVLDRVTGRQEWHASTAVEIFKDNMLFGCGGWGYQHFSPTKILDKDGYPRRVWGSGSANVHNDYLQFLAEHGAVGLLMLAAIVGFLVAPIASSWKRLSKTARFLPAKRQPPPPQSFFAFPSAAFATLVAALLPLIHAFGDCPLRSPAILTLFFTTLAATGGFLPRDTPQASEGSEKN